MVSAIYRFKEKAKNYEVPEQVRFGTKIITYSIAGTLSGLVAGEIIDQLPYVSQAVPKGAQMIAALRLEESQKVYELFHKNIDKLGSFGGLLIGVAAGVRAYNAKKSDKEK